MKKTALFAIVLAIFCSLSSCEEPQTPTTYRYFLYEEPCMLWGYNKTQVMSWMKSNGFVLNQEYTTSDYHYVIYLPRLRAQMTCCFFDSKTNNYCGAGVYVPTSSFATEELSGFLSERYVYQGQDGSYLIYYTKDNKTHVQLSFEVINNETYAVIAYVSR